MLNFTFIYVKDEYYPNYKIDSKLYTSIYEKMNSKFALKL